MGAKIVGGAFAAFVTSLVQHGRASSKYFGVAITIYKQVWWPLVKDILTLEREEQ